MDRPARAAAHGVPRGSLTHARPAVREHAPGSAPRLAPSTPDGSARTITRRSFDGNARSRPRSCRAPHRAPRTAHARRSRSRGNGSTRRCRFAGDGAASAGYPSASDTADTTRNVDSSSASAGFDAPCVRNHRYRSGWKLVNTPLKPAEPAFIASHAIAAFALRIFSGGLGERDAPLHRLQVAAHVLEHHEPARVDARTQFVIRQQPTVRRRALVQPERQIRRQAREQPLQMVEQRGAALALRIESIGHEHDALRARFGRRAQLGLRVEIVADVPGRDDRHAPGHPLDHEAREFRAFGHTRNCISLDCATANNASAPCARYHSMSRSARRSRSRRRRRTASASPGRCPSMVTFDCCGCCICFSLLQ